MTRSPLRCCTSIIQSSALVQASSSWFMGRTRARPRRLPVTEMHFRRFSRELYLFFVLFPDPQFTKCQTLMKILANLQPFLLNLEMSRNKSLIQWSQSIRPLCHGRIFMLRSRSRNFRARWFRTLVRSTNALMACWSKPFPHYGCMSSGQLLSTPFLSFLISSLGGEYPSISGLSRWWAPG